MTEFGGTPGADEIFFEDVVLVDGTGSDPRPGNLLVRGDRIVAVGDVAAPESSQRIAGRRRALAPGFIDAHSHDDLALLWDPDMVPKVGQGVTTVVCGNCGIGVAPMSQELEAALRGPFAGILGPLPSAGWTTLDGYLSLLDERPPAVNAAFLTAHSAIRTAVMGAAPRPAARAELHRMAGLMAESLQMGSFGLTTGLVYEPGCYADRTEIVALCRQVSRFGGIYATHVRDEGEALEESIGEALDVGQAAAVPVHISHLKAIGRRRPASLMLERCLRTMEEARRHGQDVTADAYPYTAASTALRPALRIHGTDAEARGDGIEIAGAPLHPEWEGRLLAEIATSWQVSERAAAERILHEAGEKVAAIMHVMTEESVSTVIASDAVMIGSDGLPTPEGKLHPREFGTFPRVIRRYVREKGLLTLQQAIHRMTGLTADRFGLENRGALAAGNYADLVLFRQDQIADQATYRNPRRPPDGIDMVFVNGVLVLADGRHTGRRPGRILRRKAAP